MSNNAAKGENEFQLSAREIAAYIDHTLLKPEAAESQIADLCGEAAEYGFHAVCVNSYWVPLAAERLRCTDVTVCAVAGFPLGAMDSKAKGFEAARAVEQGAREIDMVINIGALKDKKYSVVEEDIKEVLRSSGEKVLLKVIIETALLTEDEKIAASEIVRKSGAHFIKTSTGFSSGGATVEDVALMRSVVGPQMGVKAAGGIKNLDHALKMIAAGANRLGTSSGAAILSGSQVSGDY